MCGWLSTLTANGQGFVQWPIGVTKSRVRKPHRRLNLLFNDHIQKRPCQTDMQLGFILSMRIYSDGHCTKPDVSGSYSKSYTVTSTSSSDRVSLIIGSILSQVPPANPHPILGICTDALFTFAKCSIFCNPSFTAS